MFTTFITEKEPPVFTTFTTFITAIALAFVNIVGFATPTADRIQPKPKWGYTTDSGVPDGVDWHLNIVNDRGGRSVAVVDSSGEVLGFVSRGLQLGDMVHVTFKRRGDRWIISGDNGHCQPNNLSCMSTEI